MKYVLSIFLVLSLLVGCTIKETDKEPEETKYTIYEYKKKPREVTVSSSGDKGLFAYVNQYCWDEDLSVCEAIEPTNPKDVIIKKSYSDIVAKIGDKVNIYYDSSNYSDLPVANKFELFIDMNGELEPIELTQGEYTNTYFYLPDMQGRQYYLLKVTVDNEFKGIAYHTFAINAQP